VQGVHENGVVLSICLLWRNFDRENRRLAVTTSMSSPGKKSDEQDRIEKVKEMKVYSWTLEEYQDAAKYDLLYMSVAEAMGTSLGKRKQTRRRETEEERRAREVESKYRVAGGSCRLMFEYTTEEAIESLRDAMSVVDDFPSLMEFSTGEQSKRFVNRLHGKHRIGKKEYWGLVSRFAATELAEKLGESFVRKIEELTNMAENPVLRGVLFEMLFFARIKQMPGPLKLTTIQGEDVEWSSCEVESFDPTDVYEAGENSKERVCLKPVAWNQGGYDAVIVDWSSKLVRFVQVTSREAHDLKLRYFSDCLDSLSIQGWEQWKLEIVFVVPKDNVERFRVSKVEDEDALSSGRA